METLLARGARLDWDALAGMSPWRSLPAIAKLFVAHATPEEKKKSGVGFLVMAALTRDLPSVKLLLDAGVPVTAAAWGGWTALGAALGSRGSSGSPEIARLLVEKGAPLNVAGDGASPLLMAAEKGYVEVVKAMLARGANVSVRDKEGNTALQLAAREHHARS